MKKHFIFLIFLVLLSSFAQATIYDTINNIKSNSGSYTLVLSNSPSMDEIKIASDLSSFLGITRSRLDTEVSQNQNLIILGSPSKNIQINKIAPDLTLKENQAVILSKDTNLIIAYEKTEMFQSAVDKIKNYNDKNKEKDVISEFFSPVNINWMYIIIGALTVIAIAVVVVLVLVYIKKRKNNYQPVQQNPIQTSPEDEQLFNYVSQNLAKGYKKEDLKTALLNAGWPSQAVENVFRRF